MAILVNLIVILSAISLSIAAIVKPSSNNFELLILHNNDMHARFEQTSQMSGICTLDDKEAGKCYGGFSRIAYLVKEARKAAQSGTGPPVLFLNAGDTYTGSSWFTIYKWKIAAEFVNALRPDAMSLGNHEFDDGINGLIPFIQNVTSPILVANLILNKVPELEREINVKKSTVLDVGNNKIGIVGYLTPQTKTSAFPNNVDYIDEIVALKLEVKNLEKQGINIIIALGHSGYFKDLQIAKEVEGLDLVIGAHTHTFLSNESIPDSEKSEGPYPTYVTQASGKRVPVVQAYAFTKYLGKLLLSINANGEIISIDGKPLLLDNNIPEDPEVLKIVEKYRNKFVKTTEEVLGSTSITLESSTCKFKECNLGNLITDAVIFSFVFNNIENNSADSVIAVSNGGGIKSSIPVDNKVSVTPIRKGDLLAVMPFDGKMVAVTMNGTLLLEMLEHSVSNYNPLNPSGQFLQMSGIKVTYDIEKPVGSRVVSADARCVTNSKPSKVEEQLIYKVLMPLFIYNGGDGFNMFKNLQKKDVNYNIRSSTQFYISHNSPIDQQVEGRINFV